MKKICVYLSILSFVSNSLATIRVENMAPYKIKIEHLGWLKGTSEEIILPAWYTLGNAPADCFPSRNGSKGDRIRLSFWDNTEKRWTKPMDSEEIPNKFNLIRIAIQLGNDENPTDKPEFGFSHSYQPEITCPPRQKSSRLYE